MYTNTPLGAPKKSWDDTFSLSDCINKAIEDGSLLRSLNMEDNMTESIPTQPTFIYECSFSGCMHRGVNVAVREIFIRAPDRVSAFKKLANYAINETDEPNDLTVSQEPITII